MLWVDPAAITSKVQKRYFHLPPGTILSGDWDLAVVPFAESPKYLGLVEHFRRGLPWEETCLFLSKYPERLNRDGRAMGMSSTEELARYYRRRIDPLYAAIERFGFKPGSFREHIQPVYVNVGRDGEILWGTGGNHRLAIAKILGLKSIPVRVHIRHEQWQRFRDEVARGTNVPSSLTSHPDLGDLLGVQEASLRNMT